MRKSLDRLAESMSRLDKSVRVFPIEPNRVLTRRVVGSTRRVELNLLETSEKVGGIDESQGCTRLFGSNLECGLELTSVDFRVGSTMCNGDHGGVKWSFIHFES